MLFKIFWIMMHLLICIIYYEKSRSKNSRGGKIMIVLTASILVEILKWAYLKVYILIHFGI